MLDAIRAAWPRGLRLGLVVGIASIAALNVSAAKWTADPVGYVPAIWLGLLCGVLLGLSRWRGGWAIAYSLALSLVATFESAARVLPSLAMLAQPIRELAWGIHVRLLTGGDRMAGWITASLAGQPIQDTGLFIFLLAVMVWNALAWLAWGLARGGRVLAGVLPVGVLLAINTHLSDQPTTGFLIFLVCALLLMASVSFAQTHADWERRCVDYPDGLGLEWSASAVTLALVIGLVAGLAPYAGTPEGWRTLTELFRRPAAEATTQLFSGVNPPRRDVPLISARTPDLNHIGRAIPQNTDTVMWVRISDPAPPPPQAGPPTFAVRQHYWRSGVFAMYTGTGWEAAPPPDTPSELSAPPGRYWLTQAFDIVADHGLTLFAVNLPITGSVGAEVSALDHADAILQGSAAQYTVTSLATDLTASQLITASTDYPAAIARLYLQAPESVPDRVRHLAERLTAGAATPYDKALRIQNYLRETYPYKLDTPPPPAGRDAVDYFLFDAPGGFCSYYASAMAVMLRVVGVPARVVTGFAMGEFDFDRGAYRVPASAAHAWVEVYFPGYGWAEFEPTTALSPFQYRDDSARSSTSSASATPPAREAELSMWDWLVRIVGALIVIAAFIWWRWPRRAPPRTPLDFADTAYWSIRVALARAGFAASSSTTPEEYLRDHAPGLTQRPRVWEAITRATQLYEQALFSPQAPSVLHAQTVQRLWQSALPEWLPLWLAALWRRLRQRRR